MRDTLFFGQWLSQRRKAAGLTQEDLAERMACSSSLVQKLELNQRTASQEIAELLAQLLQIVPDERDAFVQFAKGRLSGDVAERKLWRTLHSHTAQPHPTNLSTPLTGLIGREQELESLNELLLSPNQRLFTLTGPPGIGKTRLAIEVGITLLDHFEDGVFFVSLATVTDPDTVPAAIAQVLGVKEGANTSIVEQLVLFLREKHLLLVPDNFEQVLDAAPFVLKLLGASPHLKVLITSREALHVHGEQQSPVPSLAMADTENLPAPEAIGSLPAIALFVDRARAVKPDFALTEQNARAVAVICARLEGLPLAIELAAARVRLLSPQEIESRLDNSLALLSSTTRHLPPKQRSLRAAIGWSYNLLNEREQELFSRLGVFVGGFTLMAAETVCRPFTSFRAGSERNKPSALGDSEGEGTGELSLPLDALEGIGSLVDKNLLKREEVLGESRYTMLEMIREYALERLEGRSEADSIRRLHAEYYLALVEAAEEPLHGSGQSHFLPRLDTDYDNIRAALRWAREKGGGTNAEARQALDIGLRIGGAARRYWLLKGYYSEPREELQKLLALSPPHTTHSLYSKRAKVKALTSAGRLAHRQGDYSSACLHFDESLALSREIGDKSATAWSLTFLGTSLLEQTVASGQEDYSTARSLQEEALTLHREVGDNWGIENLLEQLGVVAYLERDYPGARQHFEECLALLNELGGRSTVGILIYDLGIVAYLEGDYSRARLLFEESLAFQVELGYKMGIALSLAGLGEVATDTGKPKRGVRLMGASEGLHESIGAVMEACDRIAFNRALASASRQLGGKEFAIAWQEGRSMSMEQAVAYALNELPDSILRPAAQTKIGTSFT